MTAEEKRVVRECAEATRKRRRTMKTETTITLDQFITKYRITFEARRVPSRPDGLMSDHGERHWRCRINVNSHDWNERPGRISLYFSQGSAHTEAPTLAEVLDCIALDANGYDQAGTFDEWAAEYGCDTDSRKAERTFRAVKRQSEQLKRVLGAEAYRELLYNTERL